MFSHSAIIVHGLADVRTALQPGLPVTLLSAPGAAGYAGVGWWMALIATGRAEFPHTPVQDVLDCGEAAGRALEALRAGQRILYLAPTSPAWTRVAAIAAECGATLLATRPPALDLAAPDAARKLRSWLERDNAAKLR